MEVEAVLEALVAQSYYRGAGVGGAALGFEDGENVGVDALCVISLGLAFSKRCLQDLAFQECFLFFQRAVGSEVCLNFLESKQSKLGVFVHQALIAGARGLGIRSESFSIEDHLTDAAGDVGYEEIWIEQIGNPCARHAAASSEGNIREQGFPSGVRPLCRREKPCSCGGKVRTALDHICGDTGWNCTREIW